MGDDAARHVLHTDRLVLRPMSPDDVEFVFRHFSNPAVHQYLVDNAPVATRERARSIVEFYTGAESSTRLRWVITLKAGGEPIGTCGFHEWSPAHRRAEVGYDLAPEWWGQGLMFEALGAALRRPRA